MRQRRRASNLELRLTLMWLASITFRSFRGMMAHGQELPRRELLIQLLRPMWRTDLCGASATCFRSALASARLSLKLMEVNIPPFHQVKVNLQHLKA